METGLGPCPTIQAFAMGPDSTIQVTDSTPDASGFLDSPEASAAPALLTAPDETSCLTEDASYLGASSESYPSAETSDLSLSTEGSSDSLVTESFAIDSTHFPDTIFRNYLSDQFDLDKNGLFSIEELNFVLTMDLSDLNLTDLTGISYFTNLTALNCQNNSIITLDLSALENLTKVNCSSNQLTSLTLSGLTKLTELNCSFNHLCGLDLSSCTTLTKLTCENNSTVLSYHGESTIVLKTLPDFNMSYSSAWSVGTLTDDGRLNLLESSPPALLTYQYALQTPDSSCGQATFTLVLTSDSTEDFAITENTFPDQNLRNFVTTHFDKNQDGTLSPSERDFVTDLQLSKKQITDLKGIEAFPNITSLDCSENNITSLPFDFLQKLYYLNCRDNPITAIDCSKMPYLTTLLCNNDQLTSLDLSNCKNIQVLECQNNCFPILLDETGSFDLKGLKDFVLDSASSWSTSAPNQNGILPCSGLSDNAIITYSYDTKAERIPNRFLTFSLLVSLPEKLPSPESIDASGFLPEPATSTQNSSTEQSVLGEANILGEQSPTTVTPASYFVSFNSNGGSAVKEQTVLSNTKAILPSPPIKAGYTFSGWFLGTAPYRFDAPVTGNITILAKWTKVSVEKAGIGSLKNPSKGKMKVSIKKQKGVSGYEITYATDKKFKKNKTTVLQKGTSLTVNDLVKKTTFYVRVRAYSLDSTHSKIFGKYSSSKKIVIKNGLDEMKPSATAVNITSCKITSGGKVSLKVKAKKIVKSKDNFYYIFSLPSSASSVSKSAVPIAKQGKATSFTVTTNLNMDTQSSLLQSKFVVAVKTSGGKYSIISEAKYLTNPEKVAMYTYKFPRATTKKGLQVNGDMLADVEDLGVKNTAVNIPLDSIIAASNECNSSDSIPFDYNGKTYYFRRSVIYTYDYLLSQMKKEDVVVSGILLLGWRDDLTYLITPSGRKAGYDYYALNTKDKKARQQLEATFTFLAKRYSNPNSGHIVNWIIGNEVNSHDSWNHTGSNSLQKNVQIYADSFRLASTAIKSMYSNARIYISLDQQWNMSQSGSFEGKAYLSAFSDYLNKQGKIPFNIAYHAYSYPLTIPDFWSNRNGVATNKESSPVINMANISVLSKYVKKHYGKNTRIILSEQGFTSVKYGAENEKMQAAAIAYAYYLAEFDPMIDSFILSRHVDNVTETNQGLHLGLWTTNSAVSNEYADRKKYAWNVYKYMDSPKSTEVTKFALPIIKVAKWKKIVPHYNAKKFSAMPEKSIGTLQTLNGYQSVSSLQSSGWSSYGSTTYRTYNKDSMTAHHDSNANKNNLWGVEQYFSSPLNFTYNPNFTATIKVKGATGKTKIRIRFYSGKNMQDTEVILSNNTSTKIGTSLSSWRYKNKVDHIQITLEPCDFGNWDSPASLIILQSGQSSFIS